MSSISDQTSDNLINFIQFYANEKIKSAGYDKTIQVQILSCEDTATGKYKCRYQDAIIYAYAQNSDITFNKGVYVYVLVPGNDMSKNKTILGTVNNLGMDYIMPIRQEQAYDVIGVNCISSNNTFYLNTDNKDYVYTIYQHNESSDISLDIESLNQYIKESPSIIIGANFKTSIAKNKQREGHYGIVFNLIFLDNATEQPVLRSYILDQTKMVDNPYRLIQSTKQVAIFNIDKQNFQRIESITIFNKQFPDAEGTDEGLLTNGDIEITNLIFQGAERISSAELSGTSISFITPQGTFFSSSSDNNAYLTLIAQVKIKGRALSDTESIPFYWGIEDMKISSNNIYYNEYLGRGWRCLNDSNVIETDDSNPPQPIKIEWVSGSNTYIIKIAEMSTKNNKFKVAAIYNNTLITKEITIQNKKNVPELTIESDSGTKFFYDIGSPTLTCKINNQEYPDNYTYYWAYESNTGVLNILSASNNLNGQSQRVYKNKIYNVQISQIVSIGTFKCSVYNNDTYLGTTSIILTNSLTSDSSYSLVINNGSVAFQYDENGVSPTNASLVTPQVIQPLSFTVYNDLGQPLDAEEVLNTKDCSIQWEFPIKNSLLIDKNNNNSELNEEQIYKYYNNKSILFYGIADIYDINKQNNQINLTVNYKGTILKAQTNFVFVKQGEPGTNGTQFIVKIIPNTYMENPPIWPMITKVNNIYKLNYGYGSHDNQTIINLNTNYQLFKAQLWQNGKLVWEGSSITSTNFSDYALPSAVNWSILANKYNTSISDLSIFEITNAANGIMRCKDNDLNSTIKTPYANIIKCNITWEGKIYTGTIPITTAWIENENYQINLKDYAGFRYVMYATDGTSPKYDTSYPFEFICKKKIDDIWEDISINDQMQYQFSYSGNVKLNDGTTINMNLLTELNTSNLPKNQKNYKPVSKYNGECVNMAVTCVYLYNDSIIGRIHIPIHFLLNKYGLANINDWDGNSVQINQNGGYILTPQMGAGIKNNQNNFTGIIMGQVKTIDKDSPDIGLFGYNNGNRTLFLNSQSGSALLGQQGSGQIIIDPNANKTLLYSNNFWKNYRDNGLPSNYNNSNKNGQGLLIDLSTPEIRFGNNKFYVTNEGILHATNANISGTITNSTITDSTFTGTITGSTVNGYTLKNLCSRTISGRYNWNAWSSSSSIAASTWTNKGSITLDAGWHILQFEVTWGAATSGSIYRSSLSSTSGGETEANGMIVTATGHTVRYCQVCIIHPTASNTYYFNVQHNNSSAVNCAVFLQYISIT